MLFRDEAFVPVTVAWPQPITVNRPLMLFVPATVVASSHLFAASKHATKEEAQAMATKAADFLQKEGADKALAAFNAGGAWRDGDLYVFVIDKTGDVEIQRRAARVGWQERPEHA